MDRHFEMEIRPGIQISFDTADELVSFLESEAQKWGALESFPTNFGDIRQQLMKRQLTMIQRAITSSAASREDASALERARAEFARTKESLDQRMLCSLIPEDAAVLSLATSDQDAAVAGFAVRANLLVNYPSDSIKRQTFQFALMRFANFSRSALAHETSFESLTSRVNQEFKSWKTDVQGQLADIKSLKADILAEMEAFRKSVVDRTAEHSDMLKSHSEETKRLVDALTTQMALRGPVSYWNAQAKSRRIASRWWLFVFSVAAMAILFGIGLYGSEFTKLLREPNGTLSFAGTPLIAAALVPVLWVLRHIARMFVENNADARDAEFRGNLTSTFLALVETTGKEVNDAMRAIIIQALFRPGPSQQPEDSAPVPIAELLKAKPQ